jgi:arylsulfatase A
MKISINYFVLILSTVILITKQNSEKPNILILLADDVGYGDVDIYGHSIHNTTNLRLLGEKGTVFTQMYSPTPLCTPSRAGLLTGRHPARMGLVGNMSDDPMFATSGVLLCSADKGLPHSEKTIAQYLEEVGYDSYIVGKWHLGHKCEYLPHTFGFKEYFGVPYDIKEGYFEKNFGVCESFTGFICPPVPLQHSYRIDGKDTCEILEQPLNRNNLTNAYLDKVERILEDSKNTKKPFLLFMSFAHVHIDCTLNPFVSNKTAFLNDDNYLKASIEEMDFMTGEIYRILKDKGLNNNTIIYFSSDNGGDNGEFEHLFGKRRLGSASNSPFDGIYSALNEGSPQTGKCSTWEGGMRVPGFISWEGREDIIKPNTVSRQIYSLLDFVPTVLNILGKETPNNLDGIDMLPHLYDKQIKNRFIHYYRGGAYYAIRYGKWKFHLYTRPASECFYPWWRVIHKYVPVKHDKFLIFNLEKDQSEKFPIDSDEFIKTYPDVYKEVVEEIERHKLSMKDAPRNILDDIDPEGIVCCDANKNCHCN